MHGDPGQDAADCSRSLRVNKAEWLTEEQHTRRFQARD